MCGVFGVVRPSGITAGDRDAFGALGAMLKHRGPDGDGFITTDQALLGMHRLSIIDVDHGWQPFWSEDGQVGVLGNGEIYNAAALHDGLVARGHQLTSHSDIEVIAHLWEESGPQAIEQLRGMFALVIIDRRTAEVVLVRDRLGEKPLHYARVDDALWFSSELSPLVRAGVARPELDVDQLNEYLTYGFVPEPATIIAGVRKVPAGARLAIDLTSGASQVHTYWSPSDFVGDASTSSDIIASAIADAVEVNTRSDVPVAVSLSAGIDSSMVAALAQRSRGDIHAISVGYRDDTATDETALARQFAETVGMSFTRVELDTSTMAREFASVCERRDEPIADIAGAGYDSLAATARDLGYPVLLNGQGGDELFWGYPWVQTHARHRTGITGPDQPTSLRSALRPAVVADWLATRGGRATRALASGSAGVALFRAQPGHVYMERHIRDLLPGQAMGGVVTFDEPLTDMAAIVIALLQTYLRSNGLAQADRLSMAHSVEGRTPLVDHRLVELALSGCANPEHLQRPAKAQLRDAAAHLLPASILERPKSGFTPPMRAWLDAIWRQEAESVTHPMLAEMAPFDRASVRRNLRSPYLRTGRINQVAFRLLTLEVWYRQLLS